MQNTRKLPLLPDELPKKLGYMGRKELEELHDRQQKEWHRFRGTALQGGRKKRPRAKDINTRKKNEELKSKAWRGSGLRPLNLSTQNSQGISVPLFLV
jgi:hypothetical protein